jgi:hypothetical protein
MNLTEELLYIKQKFKEIMEQQGIQTKVKSVLANGIWENSYQNAVDLGGGKKGYFKFDYVMEDGVSLQVNHTHQEPFKPGEEVSYKITRTSPEYGNSGTVSKPEERALLVNTDVCLKHRPLPNDTQTQIVRQSSLTRAIETLTHNEPDFDREHVVVLANYYVEFVLTGKL